ncbi:Receptor-like protein 12 [Morus notabilis]|uniref:Receptor-like protein 12 n=1 Tax=Morus notabilis TaxID=981085 RepID=W9QWE7_9ROSA|nr:receptor-like protein 9DC3 [Morus notabilis]EXB40438.1 Receptor-like protein 12 [Morus notabilis]
MLKERFVGLLIFAYFLFTSRFSSAHPLCRAHERSSLLDFKASFAINKSVSSDPSAYSKVASWAQGRTTSNCCLWDRVECDEDTGHVISLDMSSSFLYGNIDSNSSLFKLVHLQRLNLADNNFNYSQIPTAISHLPMLTYLNLSYSLFSGQIPSEISGLSHLSSLDLSRNYDFNSREGLLGLLELKRPDFSSLIRNLTNLEELSLSFVNISSTVPTSLANFSSLTSLILKGCGLKGKLPVELFQLPSLQILNVKSNNFFGELPQFNQTSALNVLNLASNSFSGEIPTSIGNLNSLTEFHAYDCGLSGEIPFSIGNLTHLKYLDLSINNFSGPIPSSIGNLTQLIELDLDSNHFSGPIPLSFSKLINLESLYLFKNELSGTVDFDMFLRLKNLTVLSLSNNNLSLIIKPSVDGPPPQYIFLGLSFCNLSSFPDFLTHQVRMENLRLQGNHIGGPIPAWLMNMSTETLLGISVAENSLTGELSRAICNFSSLSVLRLSGNKLVGELPLCLGNFSDSLAALDLRDNSFSGSIPTFAKGNQLRIIDLSHNQLQGKLPRSLANCKMLESLSVENNQLNDVFPYWLESLPELQILVLGSNKFHGVIKAPQTDLGFVKLRIIVISYNNFTGMLPSNFIQNLKAMKSSSVGDLRYMETTYTLRPSGGNEVTFLFGFTITITIKGVRRYYPEINDDLSFIDLSNNNFGGEIPEVLGDLNGLYALDLSNNNLTGGIPSALANLKRLESLDLSQNKLSGRIPPVLEQLSFLQYFNVSHNNLAGPIPPANHLMTFGSSSYEGNLGLCGIPLPNKCGNSEASGLVPLPSFDEEQEDHSGSPFQFGWKVVAMGYGCGFVVGVFIGHVVITRKSRWFAMTFCVKNLHVKRKPRSKRGN